MLTKETLSQLRLQQRSLSLYFSLDFVCVYVWAYMCHSRHAEVGGQPEEGGSTLPPCGSWKPNRSSGLAAGAYLYTLVHLLGPRKVKGNSEK